MQHPAGNESSLRCCVRSSGEPERLAGGAFANFPDESVVIKMEQRRGSNHASQDALDRFYSEMGIEISKRSIGKNQTDVESDERAAPPEHKAHESTDVAVFLHTVAIVDPDEREVLHIVEDFEERDANKNVGDAVIAVPPKSNRRDQQRRLYRVRPFAQVPHPAKMQDEKNRNCDRPAEHQLLKTM